MGAGVYLKQAPPRVNQNETTNHKCQSGMKTTNQNKSKHS